jgi:hypothetical protein
MTNRFNRVSKDQNFSCGRYRKSQTGRLNSNNEENEWQGTKKASKNFSLFLHNATLKKKEFKFV